MARRRHGAAVRHLTSTDPILARVIEGVGPCRLEPRAAGTHFEALCRSIVYQQLSGKAAGTIHGRFQALFSNAQPTPEALAELSDEALRAVGLSRQKTVYLRDLARRITDGSLPLDEIESMTDDQVIEHLVQVKGIGRWTAQMFLMFRLGRPNVLPELDLGIQNAVKRAYRMRKRPTPKQIKRIGARWSPHASVACWYLWRSLDNGDGQLGD